MEPQDDSVVGVMDILNAMSQSLLDIKEEEPKIEIIDRKFNLKTRGRPPKQVFYRDALVMQAKSPPVYKKARCTSKFVCLGSLATKKCLTCALTDPTGTGHYCHNCFEYKHPWYRVDHVHINIEDSEDIKDSLKLQDSQLEQSRQYLDGQNTVQKVKDQLSLLNEVSDDLKVDSEIRNVARRSVHLEGKLASMRRELRSDVRSKGGRIALNDDEAAVKVQRTYRGFKLRDLISRAYAMRTIRVYDKDIGREYFFDRFLQTSSWKASPLLLKRHLKALPLVEPYVPEVMIWFCKKSLKRRRALPLTQETEAAFVIAGFFLCLQARLRAVSVANERYRKVKDNESGVDFFVDTISGESSWSKPKIYLSNEPLVLLNGSQSKRSPRISREKIDTKNDYKRIL